MGRACREHVGSEGSDGGNLLRTRAPPCGKKPHPDRKPPHPQAGCWPPSLRRPGHGPPPPSPPPQPGHGLGRALHAARGAGSHRCPSPAPPRPPRSSSGLRALNSVPSQTLSCPSGTLTAAGCPAREDAAQGGGLLRMDTRWVEPRSSGLTSANILPSGHGDLTTG